VSDDIAHRLIQHPAVIFTGFSTFRLFHSKAYNALSSANFFRYLNGSGRTKRRTATTMTYVNTKRSGSRNSDNPIRVISARKGDAIARMDGEEDGKKAEKESFGGIQGKSGVGGDSGRQDALGVG
jgi:hypothetical protein